MGRMSAYCRWDHPRMRGEHAIYADEVLDVQGSSPHARGARTFRSGSNGGGGIIPACAGSTGLLLHGRGA